MYKQDNNNSDEVSKDTVYSEMYAEMRRFRDYELSISNWTILILLAILNAILLLKLNFNQSALSQLFNSNLLIRFIIAGITTFIGFSGFYSVIYAFSRYRELRKYVDDHLEPEWKKRQFSSETRKIGPRQFILLVHVILIVITDYYKITIDILINSKPTRIRG